MTMSGGRIVAGALCILGAAAPPLASQQPTPLADSLRSRADSLRALALSFEQPVRTCPMPVLIPDLSRVERMPVAPTPARGHFIQVVPPGCVNPLFRRQANGAVPPPAGPSILRPAPRPERPHFFPWEPLPEIRLPPLPPPLPPR